MSRRNVRIITILLTTAIALPAYANEEPADAGQLIIVTGQRSEKDARAEQAMAPNLINVQSAESIAKYPDVNAAEALSRVPGISLSSDTGEGRFVNIRGLDANLNGATFGGVVLLNTAPGGTVFGTGRAVEFDTVPVNAIDRIVVTKTSTPEHEAEGLGGTIELTPRNALNVKGTLIEGVAGGILETLRDTGGYRAELALGKEFTFGDGQKLAILINGSYNADKRAVDDFEPAYVDNQPVVPDKALGGIELRRYQYNRKRFSYGADIEYVPSAVQSFYLRFSTAGYVESVNRQRRVYNIDPLVTIDPANPNGFVTAPASDPNAIGTTVDSGLRNEQETHRNVVIAGGGKSKLGAVTVDYRVAYSRATYNKPFDYNSKFTNTATLYGLKYDDITNPNVPVLQLPAGTDLTNPANYAFTGFSNQTETDRDREWSGAIDISTPLPIAGLDGTLKIGGSARLRKKTSQQRNQGFSGLPALSLDQVVGGGPYRYYDNQYDVGYTTSASGIVQYFNANSGQFVPATDRNTVSDAQSYFRDLENVYAGYGQYQFDLNSLNVLAGVRVEHTVANYIANTVASDANPTDPNGAPVITIAPNRRSRSYTNVFPTLQLRYQFTPELVGRAVYSTAIGRPGFSQISAGSRLFREAGPGNGVVNTGNPDLKPTTANSFDASLEYYLPHSGIISLGGFYKSFKNYVVASTTTGTFPGVVGPVKLATFANVANAHAYGLEASYTQRFDMLPQPFDGLGVAGNVTLVDSKIEIRPGEFTRLPATSNVTYNAALFYEKSGLQAQLSAAYVSKSIFAVGSSAALDTFQDSRFSVDLATNYAVTPQVSVYFNAKNLTNTPLRYYEGTKDRPIQREFYEATFEGGVRVKL